MAVTPETILNALRSVEDPDLHRDIVSLNFIKDLRIDGGKVAFSIQLTTPACPVKDKLKAEAEQAVSSLPEVESVEVSMTSQVRSSPGEVKNKLIPEVKNVIPVASGKGGVGKSTVSANLALALSRSGAKVGVMDADVYGPSIPMILGVTESPKQGENGKMIPVEKHGLKVMSTGFFIPEGQAVVWRGPMLVKMMDQFLGGVEWGDLDYLIVDLPPGTGDVQLTLCQKIPLTGAVVVTTPQEVALKVAEKAIFMFRQLKCPILGLVENMSYFICRHGDREDIFGTGGGRRTSEKHDISFLGEIPLETAVREASDTGDPIVASAPDSKSAAAFREVAEKLAAQISIRNLSGELQQEIKVTF